MEAIIIKTIALLMIFIIIWLYSYIFIEEYNEIKKKLKK